MSSLHSLPRNQVDSKINNKESLDNKYCNGFFNEISYGEHFEGVYINNNSNIFIASSNLTGKKHDGFITKYQSFDDVPSKPLLSLNPEFGGCSNLVTTNYNKIICGFDSGHVLVLNQELEEDGCVADHDDQITDLSVSKLHGTTFLSSSMDLSIIYWDLATCFPTRHLPNADSSPIWNVDFSFQDDNLFLSCSDHCNILSWDLRLSKPATNFISMKSIPSCLCWSQKDQSKFVVGTNTGHLFMFDSRNPGQEITSFQVSSNRLHRIKNVFNGSNLAICCDEPNLYVYQFEQLNLVHKDSLHENWIRDFCESNGHIYSVGRDTKFVCHAQSTAL